MKELKDYCYAEFVTGGIWNRNEIYNIKEFKLNGTETDCYRSLFLHNEDLKYYVERTRSVSGYSGKHISDSLLFDFDGEDLDEVKKEVFNFTQHLYYNYEVAPEYLRISFSGNKGFHVAIPFEIIASNPQPRNDFYLVIKNIVKELADGFKFVDYSIYESKRLLRIINTQHSKTGLYKIPLLLDELDCLPIDEIKKLAEKPRYIETFPVSELTLIKPLNDLYNKWNNFNYNKNSIAVSNLKISPKQDEVLHLITNGTTEGNRHTALTSLVGVYIKQGLSEGFIIANIQNWNKNNQPPEDEKEIIKQVKDLVKRYSTTKNNFRLSDSGNAERFAFYFGDDIKFCKTNGKWYLWQGNVWEADLTGAIYDFVRKVIQLLYEEASQEVVEEKRKALLKHISYSEKYFNQKNFLALAETNIKTRITIDEFDNRPFLFNCANGTIYFNEKDFSFNKHERENLLTQITNIAYNENALCPNWLEFLQIIFKADLNLIEFIQRAVGYSLTGYTTEDCLFFMYGFGANGKTTFVEILKLLFGDYYKKANYELITFNRNEAVRNDIARLNGARFVVLSEIENGKRLNESLVKDLTGGDTISARFLFKEYFEFKPQFKLWLYGNHKPVIRGTDEGIKRRIKLIPFEVTIPEEKRKPREEILRIMKNESSGILNWALEGYQKWRNTGLSIPDKVKKATSDYFNEMDLVNNFIQDCCYVEEAKEIGAKELYTAFKKYMEESGEPINISSRKFNDRLKEKGFNSIRKRDGYKWQGISLNEV